MIFHMVGKITILEAVLLLLPFFVAVYFRENCAVPILFSAGIALVSGLLLALIFRPKDKVIYAKEGFIITALAWILLSVIGAFPFFFSGEIPSFIDAFFETVSGLTTTGASILSDVESMSKGLLFWRSFTHWIGGMGVLVLIMAIVPADSGRSMHILRAEMPGPITGKFVPRIKDTAKILYLIYIGLTVIEIIFLLFGGMPLFESVVHAFGTAGTGGFGVKADSLASYSPYIQNVVTVFMLIFGVNFNIYYLILVRRFKPAFKNAEFKCYIALFFIATALITFNIYPLYGSVGDSFRHSAFQVSSVMTTTGYATANFDLWPGFSKMILFLLMFIGGCAGSTAGGLKMSRIILLFKTMKKDLRYKLHPRIVSSVNFEGKPLDKSTVAGVSAYFILYVIALVSVFFILSFEPFSIETNLTAAVSCFNNVGPGFAGVGPSLNYAGYSILSKLTLSVAMLCGRLEIYPLLFLCTPSTWTRKS